MPGKGKPPKKGPDSEGVSYTDYGRSGVTYTDEDGNIVSREEMYTADEAEGKNLGGEMSCPHRPDGIKGQGAAIRGSKFVGTR